MALTNDAQAIRDLTDAAQKGDSTLVHQVLRLFPPQDQLAIIRKINEQNRQNRRTNDALPSVWFDNADQTLKRTGDRSLLGCLFNRSHQYTDDLHTIMRTAPGGAGNLQLSLNKEALLIIERLKAGKQ